MAASSPAPTARRAGLSRAQIVAKAQELSASAGLDGWSMRDIAQALTVTPSVLYHYFRNKEELSDAVVDTVVATVPLPDPTLEWKDWFTRLLLAARPALLACPGVADRLMTGHLTARTIPLAEATATQLQRAGFGPLTPLAGSLIFNSALAALAAHHGRRRQWAHGHYATQRAHLLALAEHSPAIGQLVTQFFPADHSPAALAEASLDYYQLLIAALLDGVEHVLLPLAAAAPPAPGP